MYEARPNEHFPHLMDLYRDGEPVATAMNCFDRDELLALCALANERLKEKEGANGND